VKPLVQPFHGSYISHCDVAQHTHNSITPPVSATMIDLQLRATVGEHRRDFFHLEISHGSQDVFGRGGALTQTSRLMVS
jgi:hypothetical protein